MVRAAAWYLTKQVDENGRYRYLVDATKNVDLGGYNWPRHAGTTYFLAQAAALLDDPIVRYACTRAASRLRDDMMKSCGAYRCIAAENEADVGSNALALLAFTEIVRTKAAPGFERSVAELAGFLRHLQRPDGELKHFYDREGMTAIDTQVMYYTGEASLALSRAHRITGNAADLDAAARALGHLSSKGWSFFGSRYYFAEEHWTCQAMADLWDRRRDENALAFCLRWHEYQRKLQHEDGDSPFDGDGSFGFGPLVTPRVTPASSRGEAAVAALGVLRREIAGGATSGRSGMQDEADALERELRHAVAFVARHQLRSDRRHLYVDPSAVLGAIPASPVDMQLRIDYTQHAGSVMVRYVEMLEAAANPTSSAKPPGPARPATPPPP